MPRVCWEEQLCVSCEFETINSRCTDFLRSTAVNNFRSCPASIPELLTFRILHSTDSQPLHVGIYYVQKGGGGGMACA
jgi:hypothetical protein